MSINNISNVNSNSTPSPIITKILWRQQQELVTKSPDCVKIIINHEDPLDIQADITGPQETPYEGGTFRVKLIVSSDFPYGAPKGIFMTKIYHPNVSEKGEICVNTLKRDWNPKGWSLYNVLEVCFIILNNTIIFYP
jgi:ubiquitin-conjugating enzyme E2 S